jgi:hypothetical protein
MIRGEWECFGRAFAVADNKFREIYEDGTWDERGTLNSSDGIVQLSNNTTQICLVDGNYGYIFTLATNAFTVITSSGWRGSKTVDFVDDYFIFVAPDTGVYYISQLGDGTTEDPLDFASAEGLPDNLVAAKALHREVWLFGTDSVQVASDTGAALFPFETIQGAFIEYGCAAAYSVAKSANTIFWLGNDKEGQGVVWMATGYMPQRVSTFAIEYAIQRYSDISDAIGYTYQEDGHYFYVLSFPTGNATWVFDVNLQLWHERAYFKDGKFSRHRANCHMFAFGKHLVGDYASNLIYEQSLDIYDDNGQEIKVVRAAPHISDEDALEYIFHRRLQIDMETGIGLTSGVDSDPQVMLRWSDDGGHTWSKEHWKSAGKIGQYLARAVWRALGRSRDRVYEMSMTSACKKTIIAANITTTRGTN